MRLPHHLRMPIHTYIYIYINIHVYMYMHVYAASLLYFSGLASRNSAIRGTSPHISGLEVAASVRLSLLEGPG